MADKFDHLKITLVYQKTPLKSEKIEWHQQDAEPESFRPLFLHRNTE